MENTDTEENPRAMLADTTTCHLSRHARNTFVNVGEYRRNNCGEGRGLEQLHVSHVLPM